MHSQAAQAKTPRQVAAMSLPFANDAIRLFLALLTVLLALSLLEVFRRPADDPDPAEQGDAHLHGPDVLPQGRHAAPLPSASPLPHRSPGQSGWAGPATSSPAAPLVSYGGPPWGPAPKPSDLDVRRARRRS